MPAPTIVTPEALDILEEDIKNKNSISEELLRKIAAALNHANYYSALPLGTILENFIPPTKFFELATNAWLEIKPTDYTNTDYGQWLIANGLASGTLILPDGRGMEFVGVNSGRTDGYENNQDISAGQFQSQRMLKHSHLMFNSANLNNGNLTSPNQYVARRETSGNEGADAKYTMAASAGNGVANIGKTSDVGDNTSQLNSNRIGVYRYIKVWKVSPDL